MERIITYNFGEDFIARLSNFLVKNFLKSNNDLSHIGCVFGGRRPALFLQRELSKNINKAYLPPHFFSMDEFVDSLSYPQSQYKINDLDACFLIYTLAKKHLPKLMRQRESFSAFLPWAREIISFIEQIDLEDIKDESLLSIEKSASIGYEIPENINHLLTEIISLRDVYHKALIKKGLTSRGLRYLQATRSVEEKEYQGFEKVIFCNLFYLHATEQKIVKSIYKQGKGVCIFQGSQERWSVLANNAKELNVTIKPEAEDAKVNFFLYQGFDMHSQVGIVRDIISKIKNKNNTLIVLPQAQALIPLLTEISSLLDDFNISLGYPLKRSSLYVLFDLILKAQEQRSSDTYYTKDYLNLLRHPLIKNLEIGKDSAITRVMVHKIEEFFQGQEETSIGGSLFLSLKEIEAEEKIYLRTQDILGNMGILVSIDECRALLAKLHQIFFKNWENIFDFNHFSITFLEVLNILAEKSMLNNFPFNFKVIEKLYGIGQELGSLTFNKEKFSSSEIWDIFQQKLQSEVISFIGSPLRGTQILGLLETRSLSFENVIIMDLNEAVLPKIKIYEPLIPREVMLNLGLNRLEKEEEIQRYHFMRLISGAKSAHLIYEENQEREKSRFIEELLWTKQRELGKLKIASIPKARFTVEVASPVPIIKKTEAMVEFLKKATYSASRLNTYLNCPLQFYYQYVLGLKEREDLLGDPQASHIGIFIHELLADTFKVFIGVKPVIDKNFRKSFFKKMEEKFEILARRMRSDSFLLKQIIDNRMHKFLDNEARRNVGKIISLESECRGTWMIDNKVICFRYTADRIDQLEDKSIVVIDYKTGGANIAPKRLSALQFMEMNRESIKKTVKSFQLPLYYHFTSEMFPGEQVNAEIYNVRTCERKSLIYKEDISKRDKVEELFLKGLETIFRELFDSSVPFVPDRDGRKCQFCPFSSLCR